jgi:ribosomal protein L28
MIAYSHMAKQCTICNKGSRMVWSLIKLRGKYNPTVKNRKYPNLQWVKLNSGKRVLACTKCIKALAKRK